MTPTPTRPEPTTLPVNAESGLPYLWAIWGLKGERCDLVALTTTEEARERYLEHTKHRFDHVRAESVTVDHLYGDGMLSVFNEARFGKRMHRS